MVWLVFLLLLARPVFSQDECLCGLENECKGNSGLRCFLKSSKVEFNSHGYVCRDGDHCEVENWDEYFMNMPSKTNPLRFVDFPAGEVSLTLQDFDEDGHKDAFVSNNGAVYVHLFMKNTNTFSVPSLKLPLNLSVHSGKVGVFDLNHDGLKDIVAVDENNDLVIFWNDDQVPWINKEVVHANTNSLTPMLNPTFWDMDQDGDMDLVVGTMGFYWATMYQFGSLMVFENLGNGTFTLLKSTDHPLADISPFAYGFVNPTFQDWDGDGYEDLFVGDDFSLGIHYYHSTGNGTKFVRSEQDSPFHSSILLGGRTSVEFWNKTTVFTGNSAGFLVHFKLKPLPSKWVCTLASYDDQSTCDCNCGSIDPDCLHNAHLVRENQLFSTCDLKSNRWITTFQNCSELNRYDGESPTVCGQCRPFYHAYNNNDVASNNTVCRFNGVPKFDRVENRVELEYEGELDEIKSTAIAFQDLNGDFIDDAIVTHIIGIHGVYFGNKQGQLTKADDDIHKDCEFNVEDLIGMKPAFLDVDDDGLVDFVFGGNHNIHVCHNVGNKTAPKFVKSESKPNPFTGIVGGQSLCPVAFDINGDGLEDLIIGTDANVASIPVRADSALLVFLNEGNGAFREWPDSPLSLLSVDYLRPAPAFFDVDDDGDIDLVVGTKGTTPIFFRNDGVDQFEFVRANDIQNCLRDIEIDGGWTVPAVSNSNTLYFGAAQGNIHAFQGGFQNHTFSSSDNEWIDMPHGLEPHLFSEFRDPFGLSSLAFGDLDGAWPPEAVVLGTSGKIRYWSNWSFLEQDNPFRDISLERFGAVPYPMLGDVNNDGLIDLTVTFFRYANWDNGNPGNVPVVFRNTGTMGNPNFTLVGFDDPANPFIDIVFDSPSFLVQGNLVFDEKDILMTTFNQASILRFNGTHYHIAKNLTFPVGKIGQPGLHDLDGDGDLDLVMILDDSSFVAFTNTDGNATFALDDRYTFINNITNRYNNLALIDLDGDGDLDIYGGLSDGRIGFMRNPAQDCSTSCLGRGICGAKNVNFFDVAGIFHGLEPTIRAAGMCGCKAPFQGKSCEFCAERYYGVECDKECPPFSVVPSHKLKVFPLGSTIDDCECQPTFHKVKRGNDGFQCVCEPGMHFSSVSNRCEECPIGTYNDKFSLNTSCISCNYGLKSTTTTTKSTSLGNCTCSKGFELWHEECVCERNSYGTPETGCVVCPDTRKFTEFPGATMQSQCLPGVSQFILSSRDGFIDVRDCADPVIGGDSSRVQCDVIGLTLETLPLRSGNWRIANSSVDIQTCPVKAYCNPGQPATTTTSESSHCTTNHKGILCEECVGNAAMDGDTCQTCDASKYDQHQAVAAVWLTVFVIITLILPIIYVLVKGRKSKQNLHKQEQPTKHRCPKVYDCYKATRETFSHRFAVILRLAFVFFQIYLEMLYWSGIMPSSSSSVYQVIVNWDLGVILQAIQVGCYITVTYLYHLMAYTFAPLVLLLGLFIGLAMLKFILKATDTGNAWRSGTKLFLMVLYFVYPTVSSRIFGTFLYDRYPRYLGDEKPVTVLRFDHAVEYNSTLAVNTIIYAAIMVLIYPIGVILGFVKVIHFRDHVYEEGEQSQPHYMAIAQGADFLTKPYNHINGVWFLCGEMIFRLLMTSIVLLVSQASIYGANALFLILTMFAMISVIWLHPYRDQCNHLFAIVSIGNLFLLGLVPLIVLGSPNRPAHQTRTIILSIIAVLECLAIIFSPFYNGPNTTTAREKDTPSIILTNEQENNTTSMTKV